MHAPEHAALYDYINATYRPDPEDERIARLVEESVLAEGRLQDDLLRESGLTLAEFVDEQEEA